VNTDASLVPAIAMILALFGGSFLAKGAWRRRNAATIEFVRLRDFLRASTLGEQRVRARLFRVRDGAVVLGEGDERQGVRVADDRVLSTARRFFRGRQDPLDVVARLVREEETMPDDAPTDYRAAPHVSSRRRIVCLDIEPAPAEESVLPESPDEIGWCLRMSARIAAVLATLAIVAMIFAQR
jgi:hypothetical protein